MLIQPDQAVADLNAGLKRTSDPRILLEMTLMRLLKMETSVSLAEVLDKLNLLNLNQSGCVKSPVPIRLIPLRRAHFEIWYISISFDVAREYLECI